MICKYFLPFLEFPFLSVDRVIWYTLLKVLIYKFLILMKEVQYTYAFAAMSRKSVPRTHAMKLLSFFPPLFVLCFYDFISLRFLKKSILSILCKVKVQPTSLFCMWMSTFPSTSCWKNCPCPCACSWHPCQNSFDHICEGLFVGSLFHWPMCLSLCQYHTRLITVALW